ncbi:putative necrosis-inducing factor domain containing protein [Naviculisporaceae sp. PSN 640]
MALYGLFLTFFLFLASLCHGKPVDTSVAPSHLVSRDEYSFCHPGSLYYNQTKSSSPLASDCQTMIDRIKGGGVYQVRLDGSPKQLLSYNTCHVSFQGSVSGSPYINVGNKDIMTYVQYVINYFKSSAGRVGANGYTTCRLDGAPDTFPVRWDVY